MIADRIMSDQQAGRSILAVIGNAPQQAFEERQGGFARLADLLRRHGEMMAAFQPELGTTATWPDPAAAALEMQREVEMIADDLAAREAARDEHWQTDLVRLVDVFERLCVLEQVELIPRILALPPDRLALLSRIASRSMPTQDHPGNR